MARTRVPATTSWARTLAYSRAVRVGSFVAVSQTSAVDHDGRIAGAGDPYAQALHALRNVQVALEAVGARLDDVIRTRIYLARLDYWSAVARAHAEFFHDVRPAAAIVTCAMVSAEILVEFEVDAIVTDASAAR